MFLSGGADPCESAMKLGQCYMKKRTEFRAQSEATTTAK